MTKLSLHGPNAVRTLLPVFLLGLAVVLLNADSALCEGRSNEICIGEKCTKIRTYKSPERTAAPNLLIVLHGDAPFNNPGYQYRFARLMAQRNDNVVAIGMLRPGYTDQEGRTSNGKRGQSIGDNYDEARVKQIADAISELKKLHTPARTVIAGHSGGAALAANLIALHPGLVDHAFLVACPCDVTQWRSIMYEKTGLTAFKNNISVTSPITLVDRIPPDTKVTLIVGKEDRTAPPKLSRAYAEALKEKDINVTMRQVEGGHEIFLSPSVMEPLSEILTGKTW